MSAAKLRSKSKSKLSPNLVINGDFEQPHLASGSVIYDAVPGWTGTAKVEIGRGDVYNINWGDNNQVSELDTYQNTRLDQIINLAGDVKCVLKFKYAGRDGDHLLSGLAVFFNNDKVYKDQGCHGYIAEASIDVQGKLGANTLSFKGTGEDDGKGVAIDDVQLFCEEIVTIPPPQCKLDASIEYIVNGGFEDPMCHNGKHYYPNIPGWSTFGILEIGTGNIYNAAWPSQVLELDSTTNYSTWQSFTLNEAGTCLITFQHAATTGDSSSALGLYFNGAEVFSTNPTDKAIYNQAIKVIGLPGTNTIKFEGRGASDKNGATIDNVSIHCSCPDVVEVPDEC
jgi:hypothetical protein